jgi:hypothetical protein
MTTWQWPQFVVAATMLLGFALVCVSKARDRNISSEEATLHILGWAVYEIAYALVLHAGGLW